MSRHHMVDGVRVNFTKEEEDATDIKEAEYNAHAKATAYIAKRVAEYPTIGEQFDKIYHDGIDEWKKVIKAVKDKYPKE